MTTGDYRNLSRCVDGSISDKSIGNRQRGESDAAIRLPQPWMQDVLAVFRFVLPFLSRQDQLDLGLACFRSSVLPAG